MRWEKKSLCPCATCFFISLILKPCRAALSPAPQPREVDGISATLFCAPSSSRPGPSSLSGFFFLKVPKSMLQGEPSPSAAGCTRWQGRDKSCVWLFQLTEAVWGDKGFRIDQKNPNPTQNSWPNWAEEQFTFYFKSTLSKVNLKISSDFAWKYCVLQMSRWNFVPSPALNILVEFCLKQLRQNNMNSQNHFD